MVVSHRGPAAKKVRILVLFTFTKGFAHTPDLSGRGWGRKSGFLSGAQAAKVDYSGYWRAAGAKNPVLSTKTTVFSFESPRIPQNFRSPAARSIFKYITLYFILVCDHQSYEWYRRKRDRITIVYRRPVSGDFTNGRRRSCIRKTKL